MTEIIATSGAGCFSDEIERLREKLEAPPFSAYGTFVAGAVNRRGEPLVMVDGTAVRARIVDDGRDRARVEIRATDSRGVAVLRTRAAIGYGEPWFIALQGRGDAALLAAVECRW